MGDGGAAHQGHVPLDFAAHEVEGARSTPGWPAAARGEEVVASDADGFGAEGEGLEDVGAALNAAVHQDVETVAGGVDDFRELVRRRAREPSS